MNPSLTLATCSNNYDETALANNLVHHSTSKYGTTLFMNYNTEKLRLEKVSRGDKVLDALTNGFVTDRFRTETNGLVVNYRVVVAAVIAH